MAPAGGRHPRPWLQAQPVTSLFSRGHGGPAEQAAPTRLPRAGRALEEHSLPVQGRSGRPGSTRRWPRVPGPAKGPGSLKMQGKWQLTLAPGRRPLQRGRGLRPGARPRWGPGRGADPNTHSLAPTPVPGPALSGLPLLTGRCLLPWLLWRCTRGHLAWLSGERTHVSQEASWLQRPGKFQVQRAPQPQLLPLPPIPERVPMHAPLRAVPGVCGQRLPRLALALPQPRRRHSSSCSSSSEPEGPWRTSSYHLLVRVFIWMRPWCRSSCVSLRVKKGFRYLASSHMKPLRSCRLT